MTIMAESNLTDSLGLIEYEERETLSTAIHEAGHAVAHLRYGLELTHVRIIPTETTKGACGGEGIEHTYDPETAMLQALAYCSSYAAMLVHGFSEDEALIGCDDDLDSASYLIERWGLTNLDDIKARAVDFMRQPENVRLVAEIARHLIQWRCLDGDYVTTLAETFEDEEEGEADWLRYLQLRDWPKIQAAML